MGTLPGPRSQALLQEMSQFQSTANTAFFIDYQNSEGNFFLDADGNRFLDVFTQISSLPLGYNHPALAAAVRDPKNLATLQPALITRPALGKWPDVDWVRRLKSSLIKKRKRGGIPPTAEEVASALENRAPGSPDLAILGFEGGFHGRSLGALSVTSTRMAHCRKLDMPTLPWPHVPFPDYRYPLAANQEYNDNEDSRCLAEVDKTLVREGHRIAGVIVEPVQAEGGDRHASPAFFRSLRDQCTRHGVAFMVDEVQTGGGATGKWWAHEHWDLPIPPDFVTFSKKMLSGGFYAQPQFRVDETYRIFNTWMGDPSKLVLLEAVIETVLEEKLLDQVVSAGNVLTKGLNDLEVGLTWMGDPSKLVLLEAVIETVLEEKLLDQVVSAGNVLTKELNELEVGAY